LGSERLFIAGDRLASVRAVRRRAEATLCRAYYGEADPPLLLELHLVDGLCRRWIRRHVTRLENRPSLRGARRRMVDAHFRRLLDESAERIRRAIYRVLSDIDQNSNRRGPAPVRPTGARPRPAR